MRGYIVNLIRRDNSVERDKDHEAEQGHVASILGHYDYFTVLECRRMADFFFTSNSVHMHGTDNKDIQRINLVDPLSIGGEVSIENRATGDVQSATVTGIPICKATEVNLKASRNCVVSGSQFTPCFFLITLFEIPFRSSYAMSNMERKKEICCQLERVFKKSAAAVIEEYRDRRTGKADQTGGEPYISLQVLSSLKDAQMSVFWYTNCAELPGAILLSVQNIRLCFEQETLELPLFEGNRTLFSILRPQMDVEKPVPLQNGEQVYLHINLAFCTTAERDEVMTKLEKEIPSLKVTGHSYERYGQPDLLYVVPLYGFDLETLWRICPNVHTRVVFEKMDHTIMEYTVKLSLPADKYNFIAATEHQSPSADFAPIERLFSKILANHAKPIPDVLKSKAYTNGESDFITRNTYIAETMQHLHRDYQRCRSVMDNPVWVKDLDIQFQTALHAIDALMRAKPCQSKEEQSPTQFYKDSINAINAIIQALLQTYGHIGQSNTRLFDTPGSTLPYSGSFRSIVWAFNGIFKKIIKIIYLTPKDTEQTLLIPIITFRSEPTIEVTAYSSCLDDTLNSTSMKEAKLLIVSLPFAALYNVHPYLSFAAHECHHYAAPTSRYNRNRLIAVDLIATFLTDQVAFAIKKRKSETTASSFDGANVLCRELYLYISERVLAKYEDIIISVFKHQEKFWDDAYFKEGFDANEMMDAALSADSKHFFTWMIKGLQEINDHGYVCTDGIYALVEDICAYTESKSDETEELSRLRKWVHESFLSFKKGKQYVPYSDGGSFNSLINRKDAIHEACCDIFMIQCLKMDFVWYLNFVADYLMSSMVESETFSDIPPIYKIRLGMVFGFFARKEMAGQNKGGDGTADTGEKALAIVQSLVDGWKKENEENLLKREEEGRDKSRIVFRLKFAAHFQKIYTQYYLESPLRTDLLAELLETGDFARIVHDMEEGNKRSDLMAALGLLNAYSSENVRIQKSGESKRVRENKMMAHTLKLVETFAAQDQSWSDMKPSEPVVAALNENRTERLVPLGRRNGVLVPEYNVHSRDDFFRAVVEIVRELKGPQDGGEGRAMSRRIWFRGAEQQQYDLLPSIYRSYKDKNSGVGSDMRGKTGFMQKGYLNEFLSRASASVELDLNPTFNVADWLAALQHYNGKSHFLDWSEDLIAGMYFMLEPLLLAVMSKGDGTINERAKKSEENGTALYILDPIAHNEAWFKYLENFQKKLCNESLNCAVLDDFSIEEFSYYIPNLSIQDTANAYESYLLGRKECRKQPNNACGCCPFQYPVSIQTNRSNRRIKAQSGTFVAYSANALRTPQRYDLTEFQALLLERKIIEKPFLYKLTITDKTALHLLREWMETAGSHSYRFYPNLEKIGNEASAVYKFETN